MTLVHESITKINVINFQKIHAIYVFRHHGII